LVDVVNAEKERENAKDRTLRGHAIASINLSACGVA
jgi:hypothetical protein